MPSPIIDTQVRCHAATGGGFKEDAMRAASRGFCFHVSAPRGLARRAAGASSEDLEAGS